MKKLLPILSLAAIGSLALGSAYADGTANVVNATNCVCTGGMANPTCTVDPSQGYEIQAAQGANLTPYGDAFGVGASGPAPLYVQGGMNYISVTKAGTPFPGSFGGAVAGATYYAFTMSPMDNVFMPALKPNNPCQ